MREPGWHHVLFLLALAFVALAIGAAYAVLGAAPAAFRWHALDDIFQRGIGAALAASALLMLLRWRPGFAVAAAAFALLAAELPAAKLLGAAPHTAWLDTGLSCGALLVMAGLAAWLGWAYAAMRNAPAPAPGAPPARPHLLVLLLRPVLVVVTVALVSFAVCVQFVELEFWAPYVALGVFVAAYYWLFSRFRFGPRAFLPGFGFGIAALLLFVATGFASLLEGGLDDGPFTGRDYAGDVAALKASYTLPYRRGKLVICNRDPHAPVVAYVADGKTQWATEMYVDMTPGVTDSELHHMERPAVSSDSVFRDRLDFVGWWTYGAERGHAYIWKWGRIQRFYLSW